MNILPYYPFINSEILHTWTLGGLRGEDRGLLTGVVVLGDGSCVVLAA